MNAKRNQSDDGSARDQGPLRSNDSLRHNPATEHAAKGATSAAFGYARVSLHDGSQDPGRQISELEAAGAERVWVDRVSGLRAEKPELTDLLSHLRAGDHLLVTELSRLGRDVRGVLELVDRLEAQGVALKVLNLGLDTSTATGRVVLTVLAAVSRLELDLLRERTRSGMAEARRRGARIGRPAALNPKQVREVGRMWNEGRHANEIAALFGVSRRTVERVARKS